MASTRPPASPSRAATGTRSTPCPSTTASASAPIYLGINAIDFSGYPDCRPEFLDAFRAVARAGTRRGAEGHPFDVRAPLLRLRKSDIVRLAVELAVPIAWTLSCYDPPDPTADASRSPSLAAPSLHCGRCDACHLRRRGFLEAGLPDPTAYAD